MTAPLAYDYVDGDPHHNTTLQEIQTNSRDLNFVQSEWFSILSQVVSSLLLFILIFGMSATVEVAHLREQVHNKFAILTGVATQFIIMPLLGYISVMLLREHNDGSGGIGGLTEPMAISLLIVTSSPGGSYSNWWCSMFNADLALSVTMTAISTMISSVMLPANLLLYVNAAFGFGSRKGENDNADGSGGESVLGNIDWASLFVSLAIVIVAIGLGLCASFKISSHRFNRLANRLGSLSGVLLIVFSAVLSSLSNNKEAQIWGQHWTFYVGVSLPCLVGLCIATIFATLVKLKKPERISVGVECCYQNVGIATSACVAMFDDPVERGQALCVPLFYGLMEAAVLGIYCIIAWKCGWTKAARDDKFCTMIMTTYEVDDDDIQSTFDEGGSDEEGQITAATTQQIVNDDRERQVSPLSNSSECSIDTWEEDTTVHRWWSVLSPFGRRKKRSKSDGEVAMEQRPTTTSPPRRISLTHAAQVLSDGIDSITEDGFGSPGRLVSFTEDKGQYTRCRVNSEDSGVVTEQTGAMSLSDSTSTMTEATGAIVNAGIMEEGKRQNNSLKQRNNSIIKDSF
eukprot:g11675.t1 g11675   contig6:359935-361647(-)